MEPSPMAECQIRLMYADGREVRGRISVEHPYQVNEREARCTFWIEGLAEASGVVVARDTLQALLLALQAVSAQVSAFERGGGKVAGLDGAEFDRDLVVQLARPRAAFLETEIQWLRFDVTSAFAHSGLGAVSENEREHCSRWLSRHGYTKHTIDCSAGVHGMRRQLGDYLSWEDQFGYKLEDRAGNLDALRDGFNLNIGNASGLVLELLTPEVAWKEDPAWFDGFLAVAVEQARYQLALGYRFLVVLYVESSSPLVGRVVATVEVPSPWRNPSGAPESWSS